MSTDSRASVAAPEQASASPPMRDCLRCGEPMAVTKDRNYHGRRHRARGLCTACLTTVQRTPGELAKYPRIQRNQAEVVAAYQQFMTEHPRARMHEAATALGIPRPTLSNTLRRHRLASEPAHQLQEATS